MTEAEKWMDDERFRSLWQSGQTLHEIAEANEQSEGWQPSRAAVREHAELISFSCWACNAMAGACPECVTTIIVDPVTGLPPDLMVVRGRFRTRRPTARALARSSPQPICDGCVRLRNTRSPGEPAWLTGADRHTTHHERSLR